MSEQLFDPWPGADAYVPGTPGSRQRGNPGNRLDPIHKDPSFRSTAMGMQRTSKFCKIRLKGLSLGSRNKTAEEAGRKSVVQETVLTAPKDARIVWQPMRMVPIPFDTDITGDFLPERTTTDVFPTPADLVETVAGIGIPKADHIRMIVQQFGKKCGTMKIGSDYEIIPLKHAPPLPNLSFPKIRSDPKLKTGL